MKRVLATLFGLTVAAVMTAAAGGDVLRLADVQALPGGQIAGRRVTGLARVAAEATGPALLMFRSVS